jgi:hypothetical protein
MKIYLAGSVPKGDAEAKTAHSWRLEYQVVLEKVFQGAEFIDPYVRGAGVDEADSLLVVGLDCGHLKESDLIVVNAEGQLGAGTSQELVIAKYFKLPVITVLPKDTYHRRSNVTFHEVLVEDWIHPFVNTFSDFVVEHVGEVANFKEQLTGASIKDISIVDEAVSYAKRFNQELV